MMSRPRSHLVRSTSHLDASDIIDIRSIVELSNVVSIPLDSSSSSEQLYTSALITFEKCASVFDESIYNRTVLDETASEAEFEKGLLKQAVQCGVPETHLPSARIRSIPPKPPAPTVLELASRRTSTVSSVYFGRGLSRQSSLHRPPSAPLPHRALETPRLEVPRGSFSVPNPEQLFRNGIIASTAPNGRNSTATTNSMSSFMSHSSQASSARHSSYRNKHKRRDSFMQFFRREFHPTDRSTPMPETAVWDSSAVSEGENASDHYSANDISSVQSTSMSSRTSTSSSLDLSALSWLDRKSLQKPLKSAPFVELQTRCQSEAKRFLRYTNQQRVALPLFVGRSRVYAENRIESKLKELREQHDNALDELENRHIEQELAEMESQKAETEESSAKNATALKYVQQRLDILGDSATAEQRKRLEEEELALDNLAERQKRDMRLILRTQNRERLSMQRRQNKELVELKRDLLDDYESKVREKLEELQSNLKKLEEQIHDRSIRLVARWYLQVQIFKAEDKEAVNIKGPLPLTVLGLPDHFSPYVACYN